MKELNIGLKVNGEKELVDLWWYGRERLMWLNDDDPSQWLSVVCFVLVVVAGSLTVVTGLSIQCTAC